MSKPKFKYVWVQRYCRRTEDYLLKVPVGVTDAEIVEFAETGVCGYVSPPSEDTLELTVTLDKTKVTASEIKSFKDEAVVMP